MNDDCCYGKAFLSVGCNRDLFLSNLYQFIEFSIEDDIINEMIQYLCEFSPHHIKVLHKNILQKREIERHVWIESEKHGRDMKYEATYEWIIKYAPIFNNWYEQEYGSKFRYFSLVASVSN
ncbi:MAG TPA: hypothetical protein PLT82_07250 [Candidatus Hydrogenedens sp.]|nr:hypothetical protein [Candidatus Hydrogenedens sp.]HOK09144.1 hypothetical protein [Candidatus Hydrogenedens sp.]HOL19262.1 hypothetical protein [Candidatus Hydrogenedens sp.]HPP58911.1 hypothetical protein [Candidatus Hydrogenedens sp.]